MENKVTNQSILFGVVGLLLGVVLAGYAANTNHAGMMRMMGMGRAHDMMNNEGITMGDMVGELKDKNGDEFDKAFIMRMIEHHDGAITMANEAKDNAKHEEIKKMADDIISAQTREISQMKEWYKNWFGSDVESKSHASHH